MIQLEGITKSFGALQVLKGIDLEIGLWAPVGRERLPCCKLWVHLTSRTEDELY